MIVSSIICEYNPFHKGHKYQIDSIRNTGVSHVVGLMSGHLMQRGDLSIFSKWSRTKTAIENGIDLMIEIPPEFSGCCAEIFSKACIYILENIGIINQLCFGSEDGNIKNIIHGANISTNLKNNEIFKLNIKKGMSYPSAISKTISDIYGENIAKIFNKPNNTLGIEYIKALNFYKSSINPTTIKRKFVDHNQHYPIQEFASASFIRNSIIINGLDSIKNFIMENSYIEYIKNYNHIFNMKNIENIILYKLKTSTPENFKYILDIDEGLENRIINIAKKSNNLEEFFINIKTKRYTLSRIRRIVFQLVLYMTKNQNLEQPKYIRILGANEKGIELIKIAKKTSSLPIFNSFAPIQKKFPKQSINTLNTSNLFSMGCSSHFDISKEYQSMIKI